MTEPPPIPVVPGVPPPPPAAPAQPAPPKAKANLTPLYWFGGTLGLLLVLCCVGIVGVSLFNRQPNAPAGPQDAPAERDVVVSCRNSSSGFAKVNVYINNTTSRERTYLVSVSLRSGSTRVGTTTVTVGDVGSHETASEDRTVSVSSAVSSCEATSVSRI